MRIRALLSAFLMASAPVSVPAQSALEIGAVRAGLEAFPNDCVAGVFEHVGPLQ